MTISNAHKSQWKDSHWPYWFLKPAIGAVNTKHNILIRNDNLRNPWFYKDQFNDENNVVMTCLIIGISPLF